MDVREAVEQIKRYAPSSLRVECDDQDHPVEVAIPKVGNKWERLRKTLEALRWNRIEAVDKDGKLLGVVEDEDADDVTDVTAESSESEVQHMSNVMLHVMRSTMKEFRLMLQPQMDAMTSTLEAVTEGQRALVEIYSAGLKQAQAMSVAPAAGEGDSELATMMKTVAPMLLMQAQRTPPGGKP